MRISCLFILLLLSLPLAATPTIQHWQTGKGAEVYFVETHELPIVDIQLIFDAGSTRDPSGKHGLALLTNSLLAEGAGGMDADAISYEFERFGAVYANNAGYDSASVSLRSLSDAVKLQPALANLKRVISSPDFPVKAFERQRRQILIGIQQKQQSPAALAKDAFYAALFQQHPYAFPNEGTEESVKSLLLGDIAEFYRHYYSVRNATVAIVGDMDRAAVEKLVETLTQSLQEGLKPPPLQEVRPLTRGREVKINYPSAQMHILVGQPGDKRGDPDYFPLYVGNHVLGGGGMVSRLFEEIREKRGLSYSAYSYFTPMREYGPFTAGIQTRVEQADEALKLLREGLRKFVENGPTPGELEASKKNITGGFPLRIDSNSDILGYVAVIGFYKLPLDYLDTFNARVEAVTIEQIGDAFRRRLFPDKMVTVMVGPVGEATEQGN
ncbi:MAG: M16 family metallopeptidase [Gammaproteobacteria bacterium]